MPKVNCREERMCAFCQHWLGKKPKTDFRTGESVIKAENGKCALDPEDQYHKSVEVCYMFQKSILYL